MDTVPQNFSPPAYNSGYGYDNSQYSDPDDTGTARGFSVGSITNPIKDALKPITKPINNVLVSIDPTNKNSNLRALFRDVDKLVLTPVAGILESIWLSPYLAAYLQSLELQINDGRAKHLPPWLKHLIYTRYPNVQIDKVRYGENIKMATIQPGTAMTIGYNVYFPGSINLDPAKIITTNAGGWDLARDVHWILHELEHTAQFISSGTDKSTWAIKYLGASVLHANVNPSAAHDAIPLERQADAKADALLNIVLTGYTRQHPTYILPLSAHGSDKSTIQLDIFINNTTVPGFINGTSIHSPNEQYRCIVQGDGNLVVYGPSNRIIWQSNTTARANPPFALGCSDDKTHMTLLGSLYKPRSGGIDSIWTSIYSTPSVPFTNNAIPGAIYIIDPNQAAFLSNNVYLEIEDNGRLRLTRGPATAQKWERKEMWSSPMDAGAITTTTLWGETTTLPAARPRANSAPFLGGGQIGYVPAMPPFQGQGLEQAMHYW